MSEKEGITPLPWEYSPDRHTHDYLIHQAGAKNETYGCLDGTEMDGGQISSEQGVIGSSEWTWLSEADAKFIVRACNSHRALIDAVKYVLAHYSIGDKGTELLVEALELAEEKP